MTGWEPSLNAPEELIVMLQQVEWGRPLHGGQAQSLHECAAFVKASYVGNPFGVRSNSRDITGMVWLADATLDWLEQPMDHDLIKRVQIASDRFGGDDDRDG